MGSETEMSMMFRHHAERVDFEESGGDEVALEERQSAELAQFEGDMSLPSWDQLVSDPGPDA